jgi:hypothetical protein
MGSSSRDFELDLEKTPEGAINKKDIGFHEGGLVVLYPLGMRQLVTGTGL